MRRWHVLKKHIDKHGWTRGAEIGVWKGQTFFFLLDNCPKLHLIGVDNWFASETKHEKNMQQGISSWKSPADMTKHCSAVKSRAQGNGRAKIMHMDSVEAAKRVDDRSLDFVFIDADHQEESVVSDVKAWRPKVRDGGYLFGHDQQWPSVQRALHRLFDDWDVHADNVWSREC